MPDSGESGIDGRRRKALKKIGIGVGTLAGFTAGSGVTSASSTNSSTNTTESSDDQGTWSSTDRNKWTAEERAAAKSFEEKMNVEVIRVAAPTETEAELGTRRLPPPTTNYRRQVEGNADISGVAVYRFTHTIEWSYNGDIVFSCSSAARGKTFSYAPLYSYQGLGETSIEQRDAAYLAHRQGIFDGPVHTYRPVIHIGGGADGYGFLIHEDDDDGSG